jgi:hypothetical protein
MHPAIYLNQKHISKTYYCKLMFEIVTVLHSCILECKTVQFH